MSETNVQVTTQNTTGADLSPEMKTYYDKLLIANAEPQLVHDQFAQKRNIPKGGGKTIEFRRFTPLKKQLTPLQEGVTPDGQMLDVTALTATVSQYGGYVMASDILDLAAIDNIGVETTELLGSQAGRTLDTITRDVLCGGTQVIYAPKVTSGGTTETSQRAAIDKDCKLTVELLYRAARALKAMNAPKVDGENYVAIVNQDVAHDLMVHDKLWQDVHKYSGPEEIYNGELGKIAGFRFVESTEAKTIAPSNICGILTNRTTLKTALDSTGSTTIYPDMTIVAAEATAINAAITAGAVYKIYVGGNLATVASVNAGVSGNCKITVAAAVKNVAAGAMICGDGAGADGSAVYCVICLGKDAYGTTEIEGGGLEHIFKPKGSGGTADPLNQRWSMGWKATKVAERLVEDNLVRIECGSTFSNVAQSN
ncbi:MAG: N4-gp56 family major capsid protein [Candidatus Excrementavichristensenella sp.]|jgi:N4-gp56 family major capsid protein